MMGRQSTMSDQQDRYQVTTLDDEETATEISKLRKLKKSLAIQKELIPLKFAILLFYGADSLFLPYLTLQMVQAGLDLEEVAIIYAVLPFVTFVVPPLAGLLADKFNQYKLFLMGLVALSGTFHTMLLFVDARILPDVSETLTEMTCSPAGTSLRFTIAPNINASCHNVTKNSMEGDNGQHPKFWSGTFIPTDCQFLDCSPSQQEGMLEVCNNHVDGDNSCKQIPFDSQKRLDFIFKISMDNLDDGSESDGSHNCTARIFAGANVKSADDNLTSSSALLCKPCSVQCPMRIKLIPTDEKELEIAALQKENDRARHQRGFWIYFMLRIIASSTLAAAFSMLDATATCMVKKYDGDLGKQRLFGVIGQATFGMVGGLVLDWTVEMTGFQDYSYLFYIADGLFFVGIILIFLLDVDVERMETGSLKSNLAKIIRMVDVDIFMFMMLILGTCWGFLESFLFVFLMELNASSLLLGTTLFMGCMIGVPFLYISDMVVRKIGSVNVITIAFILYGVRFFGYSLIWEPWLCLIFEAMEAMTVHMMAVASMMYCAAAAPPGLLGTLNGVVGSVHYSFGRGVGSFVGGILMSNYGTRATYQMFGSGAFICGVMYFIAHKFYLSKMEKLRLRRKSERVASIIASGEVPEDDEPNEKFIIPPDMMMGRRISCF